MLCALSDMLMLTCWCCFKLVDIGQIQMCNHHMHCGKQVLEDPSEAAREAAATAAFDQLWSEEQQAADRAAAKKAKKLKQKAKKQHDKSLQVFDSPSQGSGGFEAVSVVPSIRPQARANEIKSHANGDAPSSSSSGCMPVARQLFMSDDVATSSSNSTNDFAQQPLQQGSNHSYTESAFTRLSLAEPQSNSQPPSQEIQANPLSSPRRPDGNPIHLLPELSPQTRANKPGTAEQQTGQTATSPDLDSGHHGDSPALVAGQAADAEAADAEAAFLHTLFCCPITKVVWLCPPTSPALRVPMHQQGNTFTVSVRQGAKLQMQCLCWQHI